MGVVKMTKYDGREEFIRVWTNASRKVHRELLAKPPPRMLEPDPNPLYYKPFPHKIEKATLNHQASKRTKLLSQVPPWRFTEKYVPPYVPFIAWWPFLEVALQILEVCEAMASQFTKWSSLSSFYILIPSEHYVQEHNLTYVPTDRILEISKPRVLLRRKEKKKPMKKTQRKSTSKKQKTPPSKAMTARKEWLELRAAPRPIPLPPPIQKIERRTDPLSPAEREIRLMELSQPTSRYLIKPIPWNPFEVSRKAQKAVVTKRILELAEPKDLPDDAKLDLAFKPFTIKKNALRYKASKRMKELAEPVVQRKAADNDLKEDAFTVPRRALKAVCSKRTRDLAKPIVRKGVD